MERESIFVTRSSGIALAYAATVLSFAALCLPNAALAQAASSVPSPIINSISRKADDSTVLIVGKAPVNHLVTVDVISDERGQLFQADAPVDPTGHWELKIPDASFPVGEYSLRAVTVSPDGRESAPREVRGHKIKPQPLINAAGVGIGWVDIFIVLIIAVIIAAAVFAWLHERSLRKREVERLMSDREMHGMCSALCDEVQQLPKVVQRAGNLDPHVSMDLNDRINTLQTTIEKMQGYLTSEMNKHQS